MGVDWIPTHFAVRLAFDAVRECSELLIQTAKSEIMGWPDPLEMVWIP